MKKLLGVLTLILCLSFPALAGHTQVGGFCSTPCCSGCYPDVGEECVQCGQSVEAVSDSTQQDAPSHPGSDFDLGSEALIALAFILLWFRYRA